MDQGTEVRRCERCSNNVGVVRYRDGYFHEACYICHLQDKLESERTLRKKAEEERDADVKSVRTHRFTHWRMCSGDCHDDRGEPTCLGTWGAAYKTDEVQAHKTAEAVLLDEILRRVNQIIAAPVLRGGGPSKEILIKNMLVALKTGKVR